MVEIIIGNSYSHIKGLTTDPLRKLRKILSYETNPTASYFSGGFSRPKYLMDKQGNFPTGLLNRARKFLTEHNIEYTQQSKCKKPSNTNNLFNPIVDLAPYKWQLDAVNATKASHRGGIVAATGTGKSLVIALIASRLNVKTLVVVPSLGIKKQLKTSLNSIFGPNKNITVENIDSITLQHDLDYDCLIIDECHHVAAKTYQVLNKAAWNNIYYRFFLTATFFRNQQNEQLLFEGIAGQVIYELPIKKAILGKYIVPIESYYYEIEPQENDYYTWSEVYSKLVVNNSSRNKLISELLERLNQQELPTLCLVKEISHGEILSNLTGIPFASGQDKDTREYIEQFNSGRIKSLIGTTGILGEGIDTKPAEYIVIAGLGKAKSAFMQQIGRGVRTYKGKETCKIILFKDKSHKFCLRHYREQCKILKEELGIIPAKLEI